MVSNIQFPAESVFPRNPVLSQYITPRSVVERYVETADTIENRAGSVMSSKMNSLEFTNGVEGNTNIVQLFSAPFIDYSKYDFDTDTWVDNFRPVDVRLDGLEYTPVDITRYSKRALINFSTVAHSIAELEYYYDGEKIITNYDFSNPEDRKQISVTYHKLTDTLKVKAVLVTNSPGAVFTTPVVDQYTLAVGKQKMVS